LINLTLLRLNMAKRKLQKKTPRKSPVRLLNVAQGLLIGNVLLEGAFQTNVWEFMTGRRNGQFNPGGDDRGFITLPEILGFANTPYGFGSKNTNSFQDVVKTNLMRKGTLPAMVGVTLLAPPAFRIVKRQLGPLIRPMNKAIKQAGIKEVAL